MTEAVTIPEITRLCGGARAVAAELGLNKHTVFKWPRAFIPDKYWSALIRLSKNTLTPADLFAANERARAENQPTPEPPKPAPKPKPKKGTKT